jgi:hypothetical protein
MLTIRNLGPDYPHRFASTIKIATKLLLVSTFIALALCLLVVPTNHVHASSGGSLSLGTITTPTPLPSCPGSGWYSYTNPNNGQVTPMRCQANIVSNCPNAQNMSFTFGYLSPSGTISGPVNGVIVYFTGGDGINPVNNPNDPSQEFGMLGYYFTRGYEIVQLAWSTPWEATYDPFPQTTPPTYGNVQNAACRPATFLNFIYNSIYVQSVANTNPNAGMCAQGESAGSAAVAYSMTYYGAASYLDNVELISGPVLSDIDQGCEEPPPPQVTICPINQQGVPQYGCKLGGDQPWTLPPTYLSGANGGVRNWTNDQSCTNTNGTNQASDARWLAQSIVDQSTGGTGQPPVPNFSYPNGMSGWLCRSIKGGDTQAQCAANYDPSLCPNNSSPQGEIFYAKITGANPPTHYAVYPVDDCDGPEGAISSGSNVPGFSPPGSGFQSIIYDMAGTPPNSTIPVTAQCTHPTPQ